MANTTNLNMVKPAGTDHALISVINSNMDIIDGAIGALPSGSTLQGEIESANTAIANKLSKADAKIAPVLGTSTFDGTDIQIPSNANLNDYSTPGTYICSSGSIANTLSNKPSGLSANFKLFVNANSYTSSSQWYGTQIILSNKRLWVRDRQATTYGDWYEITPNSQDITIAASAVTEGAWSSNPVAHTTDSALTAGTLINTTKDNIRGIYMKSGNSALIPQLFSDGGLYIYCVKKVNSDSIIRVTY